MGGPRTRLRHIAAAVTAGVADNTQLPRPDPENGGGGGVHGTTATQAGGSSHGQRWPLVCGHRGLLLNAPENTIPAFEACLALRIGFEFDVDRYVLMCSQAFSAGRLLAGFSSDSSRGGTGSERLLVILARPMVCWSAFM